MTDHPLFTQLRAAQDDLTRNLVRQFGQERTDRLEYSRMDFDGHTQTAEYRERKASEAWRKYQRYGA